MKKKLLNMIMAATCVVAIAGFPLCTLADEIDYSHVAVSSLASEDVEQYGMLPIYGRDVVDGTYSIDVKSSSSKFRVVEATLTVEGDEMEAVLKLSGTGYLCLFMGTGEEAAAADESDYIGFVEDEEGYYTYTVPVEALNQGISCAAFSKRKEKWYDRTLLFDASSLPEDALLVDLPDYDLIEDALNAWNSGDSTANTGSSTDTTQEEASTDTDSSDADSTDLTQLEPVTAMSIDMEDGEYAIEVDLVGGSGKASITSPTVLTVSNGQAYAKITWSSTYYDYMIVGTEKYLNENADGGNSTFVIPIAYMDEAMPVIADTTAMGEPREVSYTLTFYSESIGSKSQLPQEAAKRVVIIAIIIIVGGGILNHFVNKKKY
jgi:hypothetical protein